LLILGLILFSGGSAPVTGTAVQTDTTFLAAGREVDPLRALAVTATPTAVVQADDSQQTDGVILGAALVILVIVGGTLFSISRRK
jgi:hypothetical protein